ncbi:conserved Plasmodium protein, unknown function [Plasmodium ovale wallikeri]|uniref:Uncharacterized protein n=2 Tax=Plasmodium ovale TaxID=36330 RepID=A0A1A8ZH00_PLAOA|nr:conserved Plasmodium protein, unknown function [Plasmodium ovale wallikeri]SBT43603.1 conserved Plasmodium protein, unknown function [Plasmodium ovale wallikeri]SBT78454.1 conserved Plasmodium protein, unknown function [Plasmodium ovale]
MESDKPSEVTREQTKSNKRGNKRKLEGPSQNGQAGRGELTGNRDKGNQWSSWERRENDELSENGKSDGEKSNLIEDTFAGTLGGSVEGTDHKSVRTFVTKKKIYEKNIAQIERQIQTNKLHNLGKAREILLEMLTVIKNRKENISAHF